jgi:hypothetical protein
MSIYISNSLYLNGGLGADFNENNPIIGYHSILLPNSFTADEPVATRPALNMWTPDTASVWEGESYSGVSAPYESLITLSNPNMYYVDYIGIAKHNFGDGGYTYVFQKSADGSTWVNVTTPRILAKNDAILDYFDSINSPFFRIKLTKTAAEVAAPIIAHVKLGQALVLQRRIYVGHAPATLSRRVNRIVNGSENGQYLGQEIIRSYYVSEIKQENNTPEFVRSDIVPFINHTIGETVINGTAPSTFFFAWRPSDYPTEVVYGWTNDEIVPENSRTNGMMSWSCKMECVA